MQIRGWTENNISGSLNQYENILSLYCGLEWYFFLTILKALFHYLLAFLLMTEFWSHSLALCILLSFLSGRFQNLHLDCYKFLAIALCEVFASHCLRYPGLFQFVDSCHLGLGIFWYYFIDNLLICIFSFCRNSTTWFSALLDWSSLFSLFSFSLFSGNSLAYLPALQVTLLFWLL